MVVNAKKSHSLMIESSNLKRYNVKNLTINAHSGDYEGILTSTIIEKLPFSKILFIQTLETFFSSGLKIISALKKEGIVAVNFIIDENQDLSVDSLCGMFCASEEIRGVVALGEQSFDIAKYFSSISGASYFAVSFNPFPINVFAERLNLKNGGVIDNFSAPSIQTIIFDKVTLIKKENALNVSAYLAEKYFSLSGAYMAGVLDEGDYSLLKKELLHLIDLCFLGCSNDFNGDVEGIMKLALDYDQNFFNLIRCKSYMSCLTVASFLYHGGFKVDKEFAVKAAIKLISLIENVKSEREQVFVCDFRERVEEVKKLALLNENDILEGLICQQKRLNENKYDDIFSERVGLWKLKKILSLVKMEEDFDAGRFNSAVKHSGDVTKNVNCASLLRHLGGLEKV